MAGRRIVKRLVSVTRDQITGDLRAEQLDAVSAAREAVSRVLENRLAALATNAERYRLVWEVAELLKAHLPHTGGEGVLFGGRPGEAGGREGSWASRGGG